jgi:hypothetical protein
MKHVHIGKHLSNNVPIQNDLKQGDTLSPLLFNFALECSIRKVQENQVGLKLNGTRQLVAYADDVNMLGNTETIIDTNKEIRLEVYVTVSSPECMHGRIVMKRSFENMTVQILSAFYTWPE